MQSLTKQEIHCKEIAKNLIEAEKLSERGDDKIAYLLQEDIYDRISPQDIPPINRFLTERKRSAISSQPSANSTFSANHSLYCP